MSLHTETIAECTYCLSDGWKASLRITSCWESWAHVPFCTEVARQICVTSPVEVPSPEAESRSQSYDNLAGDMTLLPVADMSPANKYVFGLFGVLFEMCKRLGMSNAYSIAVVPTQSLPKTLDIHCLSAFVLALLPLRLLLCWSLPSSSSSRDYHDWCCCLMFVAMWHVCYTDSPDVDFAGGSLETFEKAMMFFGIRFVLAC